mmetsp:Transcript_7159/g.10908  ORF Transcript_7159/g.10908 Transcript_7159/m.10908 type:complete len:177 (+) Transcript_7159:152-682(+)
MAASSSQTEVVRRGRHMMLMKSMDIRRRLMVCEIFDRQKACNPDIRKPFSSFDDVFDRLSAFQTFDTKLPSKEESESFDNQMDTKAIELLKKMEQLESRLETHLAHEAKNGGSEELVALERLSCQQAVKNLKFLREERARRINPAKLLCLVHGLDPEETLSRKEEPEEAQDEDIQE